MTDTNAPCPLGDALAQLDSAGWEVVRAHLSRLEEQLAQAQAGMRRRGDDMIVPMRLLDEINASGYAWKVRAEAAEAEVERLRADAAMLADDFQGCGDHSRHKQAAEAWHYCAKKIRAAIATQTGEKANG